MATINNANEYKEKIVVIGDHDTTIGFALAGVNEVIAATNENCEEVFLKTITRNEVGIVILQENIASGFTHKTKKMIETLSRPVVVAVPGKSEVVSNKKSGSIQELVKRAIGIELKS